MPVKKSKKKRKSRKLKKKTSWEMKHIKENMKEHIEFTSMLTKYLVIPIAFFIVLAGFVANQNLVGITILSVILFMIFSMVPDYARFTALIMDKEYLMEFSHSATGFALYALIVVLFSMMFSNREAFFILVFSIGGLMIHYLADEFEEFTKLFTEPPKI